jgi:hypothetical protein
VDPRGWPEEKALSYVMALARSADASAAELHASVAACTDLDTLVGVYGHLSGPKLAIYKSQLMVQATNFATRIAPTIGTNRTREVVALNAWNHDGLAAVHYMPSSATYQFISWVTPDMEAATRSLNPNLRRIEPAMITATFQNRDSKAPCSAVYSSRRPTRGTASVS